MQPGLHLIQIDQLTRLATQGARSPQAYLGVLDLARMIEGLIDEPPPAQPLGVLGLEALLTTASDTAPDIMRPLRQCLLDGKYYLEWKEIPLVFLVHGTLNAPPENPGPTLSYNTQSWDLATLFGKNISPKLKDDSSWWWSPTFH